MQHTVDQWACWMETLATQDILIVDDFISDELYLQIRSYFRQIEEEMLLKKAGIGSLNEYQIRNDVRGDLIYWLDREKDTIMEPFFDQIDTLKQMLGRYCYLSLSGQEFHLAKYPAGSHYERHLDQFNNRSNRLITVLLYLNEGWEESHGGQLVAYRENEVISIEPKAKRLLVFRSDTIEHEVLRTSVPRYSLSGWLLRQPASLGYLLG